MIDFLKFVYLSQNYSVLAADFGRPALGAIDFLFVFVVVVFPILFVCLFPLD